MNPIKITVLNRFTNFVKNEVGSVAVEFALLVPLIMIPLYVGMVDLTTAFMAKRKLTLAVNQTANVIAQYDQLTVAQIGTILEAGKSTIYPLKIDNFYAKHSLLNLTTSGNAVVWSYGEQPRPVGDLVIVEPEIRNLYLAGHLENILYSEGIYTSNSTLMFFLSSVGIAPTYTLTETYYTRPRTGETIAIVP